MKITALLLLLAIVPAATIAGQEHPVDQQLPPLVIYVNTNASAGEDAGPLIALINHVIEKSRESSLAYVKALNGQAGLETLLATAVECVGLAEVSKGCRRSITMRSQPFTVFAIGKAETAELRDLLSMQPTRSALVLEAVQHFDGRVYHLMTRLVPVQLNSDQSVQLGRAVHVRYMHAYSSQKDARQREQSANKTAALPRIGSKEARNLYWTEGDPPRLLQIMQQSIKTTAEAYGNALGSSPDAVFADASSAYKKTLPVLSSLIPNQQQCANSYRRTRFVRDLQDDGYIWVTDTSAGAGIIIIPRCDFEL